MVHVPVDRPPRGPDQPGEGDDDPDKPNEPDERGEGVDRADDPPERGRTRYSWRDFELADDEDAPPEGHNNQAIEDPGPTGHPEADEARAAPVERVSGWEAPEVADHPDRPDLDELYLPEERRAHMLKRHRRDSTWPGRTTFPDGWSDDKIAGLVLDVARYPDQLPQQQDNGRWKTYGVREQVGIFVIVEPDGSIWTGYPQKGSPGVEKNK